MQTFLVFLTKQLDFPNIKYEYEIVLIATWHFYPHIFSIKYWKNIRFNNKILNLQNIYG
jgi:hypothetical protein